MKRRWVLPTSEKEDEEEGNESSEDDNVGESSHVCMSIRVTEAHTQSASSLSE